MGLQSSCMPTRTLHRCPTPACLQQVLRARQKYTPKGASGLFTFSCKGGFEAATKLVNSVRMISLVANLGDTRTLVAHPASMMHSQLTEEQQKAAGAEPETIRISIGLEASV